jgi:isocitrate dehydrogenase kinase/phosphatase
MENKTLEADVKAILAAAHERGIQAGSGEAPVPDIDLSNPAAIHMIGALMTNERTWAFLLPVIQGIEEAIARVARELDDRGPA